MEFSAAQLQYLDHLNIDVWVPRDLPVADVQAVPAETVSQNDQAYSQNSAPVQQPTQTQVQQNAQLQQTVQPRSVAQPAVAEAPAVPPQAQVAQAAAGSSNQAPVNKPLVAPAFPQADPVVAGAQAADNSVSIEKAPAFNIQFWCYGSGLWMVTDQVELLPEHHKFVHNVAGFLQGKKRKPRHVGIFSWPMLDSPNIDQGPAVASKHLADHIQRLAGAVPMKKIVAFGECEKWFDGQPITSTGISLFEVFSNPSLKKQLWQSLLPHQITD
jgi:hypothetical protein